MQEIQEFIRDEFIQSISLKQKCVEEILPQIELAAQRIVDCFKNGGKLLVAGNGGSASDAQHFVGEEINKMEFPRQFLPALCLNSNVADITAIANDLGIEEVFAVPVKALAADKDVLVLITTSGNSENILRAHAAAHEKGAKVIVLNGRQGGKIASLLTEDDIEIRVPGTRTPRIQEVHILILHVLSALIDKMMFNLYS